MNLGPLLASPTLVRAVLYVAVIVGSMAVFIAGIGVMGTAMQELAVATVSNQTKSPPPRTDVPLPQAVEPAPAATPEQAAEIGAPAVPETSIVSLTAPTESSDTIAVVPPAGGVPMRIVSDVTIRARPDKTGVALGAIGTGELVTAIANEGGWVQIAQNGSVLGWVFGRYLEPAD